MIFPSRLRGLRETREFPGRRKADLCRVSDFERERCDKSLRGISEKVGMIVPRSTEYRFERARVIFGEWLNYLRNAFISALSSRATRAAFITLATVAFGTMLKVGHFMSPLDIAT